VSEGNRCSGSCRKRYDQITGVFLCGAGSWHGVLMAAARLFCRPASVASPEEGIHQCLERPQLSFIKRYLGLQSNTSH
jgi:hypothetical protein